MQTPRSRAPGAATSPEVVEALRQQLKAAEAELSQVREQVRRKLSRHRHMRRRLSLHAIQH